MSRRASEYLTMEGNRMRGAEDEAISLEVLSRRSHKEGSALNSLLVSAKRVCKSPKVATNQGRDILFNRRVSFIFLECCACGSHSSPVRGYNQMLVAIHEPCLLERERERSGASGMCI